VLEERLWRTDNNPAGFLFFRLYNSAFIYHPYHWTPIGFKKDIENWTIEDIKNFHAKFYQPQNAFLVIAGDIDEKSAFKSAKKHFEKIKNSSDIPVNFCKEPTQNGERNIIIHKSSEVEMIALAYKIPPFNHADQNALSAVENILGSGKSSVIRRILVDEKKLANDVEIYNMSSIDENLFIIFAVANFGIKAEILKSEILEILSRDFKISPLKKDPHSPSSLFLANDKYRFGIISPHGEEFCKSCNRIRLSAEGLLIPCLYFDEAMSIKKALADNDFDEVLRIFESVVANKPEKNRWAQSEVSNRAFYETGG